jgi:hypothetical protein
VAVTAKVALAKASTVKCIWAGKINACFAPDQSFHPRPTTVDPRSIHKCTYISPPPDPIQEFSWRHPDGKMSRLTYSSSGLGASSWASPDFRVASVNLDRYLYPPPSHWFASETDSAHTSDRLTMSTPRSQSAGSLSTSNHSRDADPTYARPVQSDPFGDNHPPQLYTPFMRWPKPDVSTDGSTPPRHRYSMRNRRKDSPRELLPVFWDPELGPGFRNYHDRYERRLDSMSPVERMNKVKYSRFRPRKTEPQPFVLDRSLPHVCSVYGWQKAQSFNRLRHKSVYTNGMVDISKLPQAEKRLEAMANGHREFPSYPSSPSALILTPNS